jgi:hypothetical protein
MANSPPGMNIIPGLGRTLPPDRLTLRAMLILASQGFAFAVGKIVFQSSFMLITIQPSLCASSNNS